MTQLKKGKREKLDRDVCNLNEQGLMQLSRVAVKSESQFDRLKKSNGGSAETYLEEHGLKVEALPRGNASQKGDNAMIQECTVGLEPYTATFLCTSSIILGFLTWISQCPFAGGAATI